MKRLKLAILGSLAAVGLCLSGYANPRAEKLIEQLAVDVPGYHASMGELVAMGENAVPSMIRALGSHDELIRTSCAQALTRIGSPAVGPLIAALKDPEWRVRAWAALALGDMKAQRAVEPLIDVLANDEHWWVRCETALSLGKIGGEQALRALETVGMNGDARVNYRCEFALSQHAITMRR
jgi:HEAT repeat protein